MNKKIILCGTIAGVIACLFPPVGRFYSGNPLEYEGLSFLFFSKHFIIWNFLCAELLAIAIATFGFAYYFSNKKK